jgi:hypothetical protein
MCQSHRPYWGVLVLTAASLLCLAGRPGPAAADERLNRARQVIPRERPPILAPENLPDDLTVWPNKVSFRNSDDWLWQNHTTIRQMRPRVLVLNFANTLDMATVKRATERYIRAIGESTRYHGFNEAAAPAFLTYEVVKYVDLRDSPIPEERAKRNSAKFPYKPGVTEGPNCDYSVFYGDELAQRYGFAHPDIPGRCLDLTELISSGIVHELWFFGLGDERSVPLGTVALKQSYDDQGHPIEGQYGPASEPFDSSMAWSGRSFRIVFLNAQRGIGCAVEEFGHSLEGLARCGAIGYFRRYFEEFAGFDLDTRYGLPWKSLNDALATPESTITYLDKTSLVLRVSGQDYTVQDYVAVGGNVHFPPGARRAAELNSLAPVRSIIEDYRLRDAPNGRDRVRDFDRRRLTKYADIAPDGMGPWVVYWQQCMPGLANKAVDSDDRPMKNWWVFLFY